jgi:hypothetical protein
MNERGNNKKEKMPNGVSCIINAYITFQVL